MIVTLPDTTTNEVAKKIVMVREAGGAISLGRVLTLVVVAEHGEPTEAAIEAAIGASSEHPSRVIVISCDPRDEQSRLDAEIRVGGDAGDLVDVPALDQLAEVVARGVHLVAGVPDEHVARLGKVEVERVLACLLYTSPSPRDRG